MTNVVSALTARTRLGQIIKRATQKNERFVVDRRGEPTVVIMSMKDYIDSIVPTPEWLSKIHDASKRRGTDKLTVSQISSIVTEARREHSKKSRKSSSR